MAVQEERVGRVVLLFCRVRWFNLWPHALAFIDEPQWRRRPPTSQQKPRDLTRVLSRLAL